MRLFLRLVMVLLLVVAAVLVGGYLYITSQRGLDYLAAKGSELGSSEHMRIAIGPMSGRLFSELSIASVTLADKDGVWLELQGLYLRWQPINYVYDTPALQQVRAEKILLHRLPPPSTASGKSASAPLPSLRSLMVYLPRKLEVKEIIIAEAVNGLEQRLGIKGGSEGEADYHLSLHTLSGPVTKLDALLKPHVRDVNMDIAFLEPGGGIVGALLGLPGDMELALNAHANADIEGNIRELDAQLQAGSLRMEAAGQYLLEQGDIEARLKINAPNMQLVQALSGKPVSGSAEISATLRGRMDALTLAATISTPHLVVDGQRMEEVAIEVEGDANPVAWGKATFHAAGNVKGSLLHQGKKAALDMKAMLAGGVLTIEHINAEYDANRLKGKARAEGTLQAFDLASELELLTALGQSTLVLDGRVDSEAQSYEGKASGRFAYENAPFDFSASIQANASHAVLEGLSLRGPGMALSGNLDIEVETQLADGGFTVRASDLMPVGRLFGQPMAGMIQADVKLSASGGRQAVNVAATARKLQAFDVAVEQADIKAHMADARKPDGVDIVAMVQGIASGDLVADLLDVHAKGGPSGLDVVLKGKGALEEKPWDVNFAGQAKQPASGHYILQMTTLDGHFDHLPIRLQQPATLTHNPTLTELTPMQLLLADGSIRAQGSISTKEVKGDVRIAALALHKLPFVGLPEAVADATVTLAGSAQVPVLTWSGKTRMKTGGLPLDIALQGDWKDGKLQGIVNASSEKANAEADIRLPARLTLMPFDAGISPQTVLGGTVKARVPLAMFNAHLRAAGHRVDGIFSGDATLRGTVGKPFFDGHFTLADGRYDHAQTGICLRDMEARISGSPQAVRLDDFHAVDSKGKRFAAKGQLVLGHVPSFGGEAHFDEFRLFCGGMMNGQLDGKLAASGTMEAVSIAGTLLLGPLSIQIPGANGSADIPFVETTWVRADTPLKQESSGQSMVALDITLDAPRQLFVRGRGLDAEFAGKLHIGGSVAKPSVEGEFNHLHGEFTLLDRVFSLETAGLQFHGAIPPSPFLNVRAETDVSGTTIAVNLDGSASKPKLALSSSPTLPQDELLALILFGRQLDKISPMEAIQLARAARILAGKDDGPGLTGSIRDAIGLDRLDVSIDDNNNVNVGTGKYVTDDVYVGVVQGTKPEDRKVVTEITITPSVAGKTSVDSVGNQSVGVEWKHDY
jgi:translocation and assembly module TamB